jgi:thioredoxin reductase
VHVYDAAEEVGGNIRYAAKGLYGDEELMKPVRFQKTQCDKAGVKFHLGTEVTPELIEEEDPDSVVIATGSKFTMPEIPGHDRSNVFSVLDVLDGKADVGNKVAIWGKLKPAISTALIRAEQGKKVVLVCDDRKVGKDVNPSFIWRYVQKMAQKRVQTYNNATIEEINDEGVIVKLLHDVRVPVTADSVVYADREPARELEQAAKDLGVEVYVLGDALVPRNLSHAVHDGYRIGVRV